MRLFGWFRKKESPIEEVPAVTKEVLPPPAELKCYSYNVPLKSLEVRVTLTNGEQYSYHAKDEYIVTEERTYLIPYLISVPSSYIDRRRILEEHYGYVIKPHKYIEDMSTVELDRQSHRLIFTVVKDGQSTTTQHMQHTVAKVEKIIKEIENVQIERWFAE